VEVATYHFRLFFSGGFSIGTIGPQALRTPAKISYKIVVIEQKKYRGILFVRDHRVIPRYDTHF